MIDTNVVLDVLLKREPFYAVSADVLKLAQQDDIREYVSASAITDIYYIAHKHLKDKTAAKQLLERLLMVVSVAAVSEREITTALELGWNDFEDSVQYSIALLNEMDGVVTRNPADYKDTKIPVLQPAEMLQRFSAKKE